MVGHDCKRILPDPGDRALLEAAQAETRTIVTLDKDFGELAVVHGLPHFGIVRLVGLRVQEQAPVGLLALEKYGGELVEGAIATVYRDRVRIRRPAE